MLRSHFGDGASLKAELPWQLKHRCWKRPNPWSTEGTTIADFSGPVEGLSPVAGAEFAPYAVPVDATSKTDTIAANCGEREIVRFSTI